MWEFAKGNTFGAVAFSSYGAFWLSFWYLQAHTDLSKAAPKHVEHAIGLYLLIWAIITAYLIDRGVPGQRRRARRLRAADPHLPRRSGSASGPARRPDVGLSKVGGYLGLLTAIAAWYGSFAIVTNFTFKRVVLPVGPRA